MHLAYSALRDYTPACSGQTEKMLRYQAYLAACNKHRQTIAHIRKYLPGWTPERPIALNGAY